MSNFSPLPVFYDPNMIFKCQLNVMSTFEDVMFFSDRCCYHMVAILTHVILMLKIEFHLTCKKHQFAISAKLHHSMLINKVLFPI